jgi:hypothetical protein
MINKNNNLIIFFIPPKKEVNGGILSIFSIAKESRKFFNIHKSEVVICVFPGNETYRKNDLFNNDEYIYSFDEIILKFNDINSLTMNIPEYAIDSVSIGLSKYIEELKSAADVHMNILNQNIELMPPRLEIAKLYAYSNTLTQTTAHDRYCSQDKANYYAIPTHHLSTFIDQKKYKKTLYKNKNNVILISNDINIHKSEIINEITKKLPQFKIRVVENLKYEEYKKLISESKYMITFGEGFDGYFVEPYFCGSISFAVYNDDFFPSKDYRDLPNVYESYEEMKSNIVKDIKNLEKSKEIYKELSQSVLKKINKKYGFSRYVRNIGMFYEKKYTFLPSKDSILDFKADYIKKSYNTDIKYLNSQYKLKKRELYIDDLKNSILILKKEIKDMKTSRSWLLTRPLRKISQSTKIRSSNER